MYDAQLAPQYIALRRQVVAAGQHVPKEHAAAEQVLPLLRSRRATIDNILRVLNKAPSGPDCPEVAVMRTLERRFAAVNNAIREVAVPALPVPMRTRFYDHQAEGEHLSEAMEAVKPFSLASLGCSSLEGMNGVTQTVVRLARCMGGVHRSEVYSHTLRNVNQIMSVKREQLYDEHEVALCNWQA